MFPLVPATELVAVALSVAAFALVVVPAALLALLPVVPDSSSEALVPTLAPRPRTASASGSERANEEPIAA